MDPAKKLANHILSSRLDRIPKKAIERAKLSILDTIATAIGGSDDPISHAVRRFGQYSQGKPESRVWIFGEKLPAGLATLVNAVVARALDFDETYELCVNGCHASAYDIPPAFALAERDPTITGAEFLTAVITGMDIHLRLALTVTSNAIDTGRDNIVASWGTTAVAARLLKLNEKQILDSFGIAYAQAAGEFQMYEETSHTVALQQGLRARTGVDSAMFALAGLNGPHEPFLGKYGFFKAFEPEHDLKPLLDGLGEDYINANISFKPWPACKCTHPGIFGMLQLREKEKFTADDVVAIEVGVNRMAEGLVVQPRAVKWNPQDPVDGRFSLPAVPTGVREIEIEYVGLDLFKRQVGVNAGATTAVDAGLKSEVLRMAAFEVAEAARGQALAINQQKTARGIVNIVSEETFGAMNDGNIGYALQRLPGLTVNEDGTARPGA